MNLICADIKLETGLIIKMQIHIITNTCGAYVILAGYSSPVTQNKFSADTGTAGYITETIWSNGRELNGWRSVG